MSDERRTGVEAALGAIFDRELRRADEDHETSAFVDWLERLRDECLRVVAEETDRTIGRAVRTAVDEVYETQRRALGFDPKRLP